MNTANEDSKVFKAGYAALIGPPNAGKSTLLNCLLGQKIAITSRKPQTTRNRLLGVLHRRQAQIIFLDTPGIHKPKGALNTRIVDTALKTLDEVDLVVLVIDCTAADKSLENHLIGKLKRQNRPVILALNKIDCLAKAALLPLIDEWQALFSFQEIIPLSAKLGTQVDRLEHAMIQHLPEGPPYFPEDTLTDMPTRFIVAEIIREKVFRLTGQEVPYATAVTIDSFKTHSDRRQVRIHGTIHLERNSQKKIVIGRQGAKLKQIGTEARQEIEGLLDCSVYLKLFVHIQHKWRNDPKTLHKFGY
jgi:GTP-binding protein Era